MANYMLLLCMGFQLASMLFLVLAWRLYKPPPTEKCVDLFKENGSTVSEMQSRSIDADVDNNTILKEAVFVTDNGLDGGCANTGYLKYPDSGRDVTCL